MAPLTKLILISSAKCSEESSLNVLPRDFDPFGSLNIRDITDVDTSERIHELWEDKVLKQSSIRCDFFLEGFPSHDGKRRNNDDSSASLKEFTSIKAFHQQNIMALYEQTFYPCSIPQNLLSLNLTEWNLDPQNEEEQEMRASFTNCHFFVDPEAIFLREAVDPRPNDGLSSFLYLPLFTSQDSFSLSFRDDSSSMVLVKEVPLLLDTSHAKRLFTQFYIEHVMVEPLDPIGSIIISSLSTNIFPTDYAKEPEDVVGSLNTSGAISSFPTPDTNALEIQHKIHGIMAATIALSTTLMLQKESRLDLLQVKKDLIDTDQDHSIVRFQQNERRQMIEQMLQQEMYQIHLILLTLCFTAVGILLFLGCKLQSHSTEMRKHSLQVKHGIRSTSLQQSTSPIAPDSLSRIMTSTSQQMSPLSIDPFLFQGEPPLSPSVHPPLEFRSSASPCTNFWASRNERRGRSYLFRGETNCRRRSPIRPTNDSALMITPESTQLPTHPRVVSADSCRNECVSSDLDAIAMVASTLGTSEGGNKNENRATSHLHKPCSPPDLVVHSNSFLEEYW